MAPHLEDAARDLPARGILSPALHHLDLTGAWYREDGDGGCVGYLAALFREAGFAVAVRESVLREE